MERLLTLTITRITRKQKKATNQPTTKKTHINQQYIIAHDKHESVLQKKKKASNKLVFPILKILIERETGKVKSMYC